MITIQYPPKPAEDYRLNTYPVVTLTQKNISEYKSVPSLLAVSWGQIHFQTAKITLIFGTSAPRSSVALPDPLFVQAGYRLIIIPSCDRIWYSLMKSNQVFIYHPEKTGGVRTTLLFELYQILGGYNHQLISTSQRVWVAVRDYPRSTYTAR